MNNYLVGLEGMKTFLDDIQDPLKSFKKKTYADTFRSVYDSKVKIMDAIEEVYTSVKEPELMIDNMASAFVETAVLKINSVSKKNQRDIMLMDYNMSLAVYVFPVLLEYKGESSQPLVDRISQLWKEQFPKTNVTPAEFSYIEKGFHKKFCYITTAVCETFDKPDDCYELTLLRNYRDQYLMSQPDGESCIRAYYDVAPTIVKHINEQSDAVGVYHQIWERYLSPCIQMIENGEYELCKDRYIEMVYDLKDRYFYLQ